MTAGVTVFSGEGLPVDVELAGDGGVPETETQAETESETQAETESETQAEAEAEFNLEYSGADAWTPGPRPVL